ncbi:MAG: TIGR00268 family protein, partial [Synergistaceae bacterium]|nr:TIGR00268 family protein [Synergistaceae bacterium]
IKEIAHEHELEHVIEGSNLDDLKDYRPGMKAIDELGIKSPLRVAGLTKEDIRMLSRELGLNTWDKPSYACLASRFVYGESITPEKLIMLANSEKLLQDLGFKQERVRIHGNIARIEITPENFTRIIEDSIRTKIFHALKNFGFSYVTLDLQGYRTGSMNENIIKES